MATGIARATRGRVSNTTAGKLAYQLGWFSIALGATELLATRTLTRSLGMRGQDALVRAYGVREIVTGIGLLTAPDPAPWLWGRVAGDALDLATLTLVPAENRKHRNVGIALANVAAVTAVDVLCARQLSAPRRRQGPLTRDYPNGPVPSGVEGSGSGAASTPAPGESRFGTGSTVHPTR